MSCVFVINRPINGPYAVIDAYIELVAGIPKGKITLFFDAPAVERSIARLQAKLKAIDASRIQIECQSQ